MNQTLRSDAEKAIYTAINAVMPEGAVRKALLGKQFPGRVFLVAAGKAAPKMAEAATSVLSAPITDGVVISKYGHFEEPITGLRCFEAGHPVPDKNSVAAADAVLKLTENLREDDTVLFLLSGGGSALFEKPLIPLEELQDITSQLLACGAEIVEINTIRKRLSAVKGGKFAAHCAPAKVEAIILSDILGDPLDMIASGPVSPDSATCDDAQKITEKYRLRLSEDTVALLRVETPKNLDNVNAQVVGSVRELCRAAGEACRSMGYETIFLTDQLNCEAREAGRFLAAILRSHRNDGKKTAFLAGGETVVHLTGKGKGGRNQELALAACEGIHGMQNAAVDGASYDELCKNGIKLHGVLQENDAYHALLAIGGLIVTGPTGTNVNDICIGLLDNMIPSSAGTLVN